MSNAMRSGKRWLAGAAAGALAAGLIPFVAVSSAQAAEVTATVSPVRVAGVAGSTLESVPYAEIAWAPPQALVTGDTARITAFTVYPSASARIAITAGANVGDAVNGFTTIATGNFDTSAMDTVLAGGSTSAAAGVAPAANASGSANWIGVAANVPGTYAGTLTIYRAGVATGDTVKFSFTTTGAPKSMTLTPASASVAVSGTTLLAATLLDAAGNITQPLKVDAVAVTASGGTPTPATLTGADLYAGEAFIEYAAPGTAGTYTVTATPAGTLVGAGVVAQTSSITVSGSISDDTVTNMTVSTPSNAVVSGTLAAGNRQAKVQAGTSSITVKVTSVSNAGKTIRLKGVSSAGTPSSTVPQFQTVAIDSAGSGSATFTVGGAGLAATATLTVSQVKANGDPIYAAAATVADIEVIQTAPAVVASSVTVSPSGALVKKLGETTAVTVTVKTEFGAPVSNVPVSWVRAAIYTGTVQQTVVTDAAGQAVLTLAPAAGIVTGTTEQYTIRADAVGGPFDKPAAVTITYTTGGSVNSVAVTVPNIAQVTQPITNTSTAANLLVIPAIEVPYSGVVNTTTETAAYYTKATATSTGTLQNFVEFRAVPSPANTVTVTVPEGLKVFNGTQKTAGVLWSGGALTGTFDSNEAIYVFGTKVGTHDITFTSGGITTTAQVRVSTPSQAAYNISVTPATQNIKELGFGSVTAKVTDVFGNPVTTTQSPASSDQAITVTASGAILLGGQTASTTVTTGSDGTVQLTVLAGASAGTGKIAIAPSAAALVWANGAPTTRPWSSAGYIPPTGAAAPVKAAEATVLVSKNEDKSISITGSRTTVSGKPGIRIEGVVTGIENGKTVTPFFRFPGETTFAEGSARPVITDGSFTWQRKTGKKFYAYVTSDGVTSNRVIIPAN